MVTLPVTDKGALEWIPEKRLTTGEYGTFPTNPTMLAIGLVRDFTVHADRKLKRKRYLSAYSDATKLGRARTLPTGGTVEGSFTYYPQNWDLMPHIVGSSSVFTSEVDSLSFLRYLDGEYTVISGVMLTEFTQDVKKSDFVAIDVSFKAGDISDPSGVDPIGTGIHAVEDTSNPFLWRNLTDIRFGSTNPPTEVLTQLLGDIKISIKNEIEIPPINSSVMFSYGGSPVLKKREVTLALDFTWESVEAFWAIMKNSEQQYFAYSLGGRTFIVKRLMVPELNPKQDPEDYIGETITFKAYIPDMVSWIDSMKMSSGAEIGLIPCLSANQTSTGLIVDDIVVGENVTFGDLCYLKSDGKYWKADANAIATTAGPLLIALESITGDNAGRFLKRGYIRDDSWTFSPAVVLFVGAVAGGISATRLTAVGDCIRRIGYAYTSNIIIFEPSETIIEM
jgi:hypothetical protein